MSPGVQQVSPREASRPSFRATAAIASPATGSAHHQAKAALNDNPTSSTAERYVHSRVCLESATALAEPSSRPFRRWAYDRKGMTSNDTAASTIPTVAASASCRWIKARTDSTVTYAASARNENAITRRAVPPDPAPLLTPHYDWVATICPKHQAYRSISHGHAMRVGLRS